MGPKRMHRHTRERLSAAGLASASHPQGQSTIDAPRGTTLPDQSKLLDTITLLQHLEIYDKTMFSVWPVVDTGQASSLLHQLHAQDASAYMLAASVAIATALQLRLPIDDLAAPQAIVDEIEGMRYTRRYRQHLDINSLLTSFFLHIIYLHLDERLASTLLLQETASMAHLLGLNDQRHYDDLPYDEAQHHLRILWLLFVTERGHANQYDLTTIIRISPDLPALEDCGLNLSAFMSLCTMFASFDSVSTSGDSLTDLASIDLQLQLVPTESEQYNNVQRADLAATQQWMRLLLWKVAMSKVKMTSESSGRLDSILFPVQIARDFIASTGRLSTDALEAHGVGMELKLFALATSLIDIVSCLPVQSTITSGAQDYLRYLVGVLGQIQKGSSALRPMLQERLGELGMEMPAMLRISDADDGEEHSRPATIH